jgi:uncharacterized protein
MIDYLIIARSGRALAASAKRAGYKVSVADYFADEDTRSCSESVHQLQYHCDGFTKETLLRHIEEIVSSNPNVKLVTGSGFESTPNLLNTLHEVIPVLSSSRESIVALKDPVSFFKMLDKNSIGHPEVLFSKPITSKKYLIKRIGGIGGGHVNWSNQVELYDDSSSYYQEFVPGKVLSVVFLADGLQAGIVGFNQQLLSEQFEEMPFLYQGAITINEHSERHKENIQKIINKVTNETKLRGLCGLDYIVDEFDNIFVLEVNPRPPATFELHEGKQSLFDAHLSCFDGSPIDYKRWVYKNEKNSGYAIIYTNKELKISDNIDWPLWVKDRPSPGSVIPVKFPICTVHAEECSIDKLKDVLSNRLKQIKLNIVDMQNAA